MTSENSEDKQRIAPNHRLCEFDASDDGSSSVTSETEHDQRSGRNRGSVGRKRRASNTSQISPLATLSQHSPHISNLSSYPVSIRQQLALIRQMEQPTQVPHDASLNSTRTSSSSPGVAKSRRVPKIHKKNERGETPLHVAARRGDYEQCKKLMTEGAFINAKDYAGWTPLHDACYRGHYEVAKLLISYQADVNALSDCDDTPLHDAVASACEKLVWLLLHSGADRNRKDNNGRRPIDICNNENTIMMNLLTSEKLPEKIETIDSLLVTPQQTSNVDLIKPLAIAIVPSKTPEISVASSELLIAAKSDLLNSETNECVETSSYLKETTAPPSNAIHSDNLPTDECFVGESIDSPETDQMTPLTVPIDLLQVECTDHICRAQEFQCSVNKDEEVSEISVDINTECESRRAGRPRGMSRKERFSPSERSIVGVDRRRQKGRRRGKGVTTGLSSGSLAHAPRSDDVYEFRSSPESDFFNAKMRGEHERETSTSPCCKRPHFSRAQSSFETQPSSSSLQTAGDLNVGNVIMARDQPADAVLTADSLVSLNQADDRSIASANRKVPPLRISLPRTPSEEGGANVHHVDDGHSNAVRRITRGPKGVNKKPETQAQCKNKLDDGTQRITRSKMRQAGRQLLDSIISVNEDGLNSLSKRKAGTHRRSSNATVSPTQPNNDEQTSYGESIAEKAEVDINCQDTSSSFANEYAAVSLDLMKKNSFEGYQEFRSIVEERWANAALTKSMAPEAPPNYAEYMITKKNYTVADNVDAVPSTEADNSGVIDKLSGMLRSLFAEQQEKRRNVQIYQQVERERLQMQAETEVIRMATRKANEGNETFSAMRLIRESNLFNTGFLKVKQNSLPVVNKDDIQAKFERLAELMKRRHQMESNALYTEQKYTWNKAIQQCDDPQSVASGINVPRVPVIPLILKL